MHTKFESILKQLASRKRFLNAVSATRRMLLASLILTAVYLILTAFEILPKLGLSWLLLLNFFSGAVGFVIGYFRGLDLAAAVYHADRRLGLGEKLCTIYDLRAQAPTSDFLSMLYQRIAKIEINIKEVFPFPRAEKIKLAGLVALALLWTLLALQHTGRVDFVGLQDKKIAPTQKKSEEQESQKMPTHSEELAQLMEQLLKIQQSVEVLEQLQQGTAADSESEAHKEALEQAARQLAHELDALQRALEGAKQSQEVEQLKQDLQKLNEKLFQGASKDEISELLESIAQNIDDASFEELSEAAQAQDQSKLKELSEQISKQLEEMAELSRRIEELQERLKEQLAKGEQGESGDVPPNARPEADQPGGAQTKREGEEAGQEPNTQAGKSGAPMPKQPSQTPPEFYKASIRGLLPPTPTNTKELPAKKAPIETEVTAQGTVYRVNYQKLEAFLQELQDELSPEMLDIIRAYFQLITQQEPF